MTRAREGGLKVEGVAGHLPLEGVAAHAVAARGRLSPTKVSCPRSKNTQRKDYEAPDVELLLADLWIISQILQQQFPILFRWRVLMQFPIFERAL